VHLALTYDSFSFVLYLHLTISFPAHEYKISFLTCIIEIKVASVLGWNLRHNFSVSILKTRNRSSIPATIRKRSSTIFIRSWQELERTKIFYTISAIVSTSKHNPQDKLKTTLYLSARNLQERITVGGNYTTKSTRKFSRSDKCLGLK
jgi:hypothetical protein